MITHICDRCGRAIEKGQAHYVARIQVFAAADPLEVTVEDLLRDASAEMERLLEQCAAMTEEELMQDVFVELQFDLCRPCQRAYLANPLAIKFRAGQRPSTPRPSDPSQN